MHFLISKNHAEFWISMILQTIECLVRMIVCDAISYLLDNIYIRFGNKLTRQIVGIPMVTSCASLVATSSLLWSVYFSIYKIC